MTSAKSCEACTCVRHRRDWAQTNRLTMVVSGPLFRLLPRPANVELGVQLCWRWWERRSAAVTSVSGQAMGCRKPHLSVVFRYHVRLHHQCSCRQVACCCACTSVSQYCTWVHLASQRQQWFVVPSIELISESLSRQTVATYLCCIWPNLLQHRCSARLGV